MNDALKNIDIRSREALSQKNQGQGASLLVNELLEVDSYVTESKCRSYAFPVFCLLVVGFWIFLLARTLNDIDFDEVNRVGFSFVMGKDTKKHNIEKDDDTVSDFMVHSNVDLPQKYNDAQYVLLTKRSDEPKIKGFSEKNEFVNFLHLEWLALSESSVNRSDINISSYKGSDSKKVDRSQYKTQSTVAEERNPDAKNEIFKALEKQFYLAIKNNRLMFPKDNSAWYFLEQIKSLNNNSFYKKGLTDIAGGYHRLIQQKIVAGDVSRAKKYLNRLVNINDMVVGGVYAGDDVVEVDNNNESIEFYTSKINAIERYAKKTSVQYLSIGKVERSFRTMTELAKKYFDAGRYSDSESLLSQAIEQNKLNDISLAGVELWFDVLLRLHHIQKAEVIHKTITQYSWAHRWDVLYREALLLSSDNDHAKALQFLENQDVNMLSENALRFFAGLYQKESEYRFAKKTYKQLLDNFGDKATYWLGYAVSSDALRERHVALDAFKKTLRLGGLNPKLTQYVNDRVQVLAKSSDSGNILGYEPDQDIIDVSSNSDQKGYALW